jgi:hypothetical protein
MVFAYVVNTGVICYHICIVAQCKKYYGSNKKTFVTVLRDKVVSHHHHHQDGSPCGYNRLCDRRQVSASIQRSVKPLSVSGKASNGSLVGELEIHPRMADY